MSHLAKPESHRLEEIQEGMRVEREYRIDSQVYESTLSAFSDFSPIHVDESYASSHGFEGKVMHGLILNGFLSHFIGMHFPGANAMLLSVDMRYAKPTYLGNVIRLEAEVTQKNEVQRVLELSVKFFNVTRNELAARCRTQVKVRSD